MAKRILVYADWQGLPETIQVGTLNAETTRGKEIFSFEYMPKWLQSPKHKSLIRICSCIQGSSGTLQNIRVNGTVPFTKIGSIIYYKVEDIHKLLQENLRTEFSA